MYATVCAVDKDKGVVKVNIDGRVTNWLPCLLATPAIGQQVVVIEYINDGIGAVLGPTARCDGNPISLHIGAIDIDIDGSSVQIKCKKLKFTGDIEIDGKLEVSKDIKTDSFVIDSKGNLSNFTTTDGAKRK